jgi:hypothetical protein
MDNNDNQIHIKRVDWPEERERIMAIREAVFIVEQRVSMDIELDGLDEQCLVSAAHYYGQSSPLHYNRVSVTCTCMVSHTPWTFTSNTASSRKVRNL